jgi:galactokinase
MNIKELRKQFVQLFGIEPLVVKSPGRVNIIGEHTDYNNGFVLPAAIDKAAYLAISLRDDDEIHLVALDLNEKFRIQIKDLRPIGDIIWPNFRLKCEKYTPFVIYDKVKFKNILTVKLISMKPNTAINSYN